jgi:hypothetical protein
LIHDFYYIDKRKQSICTEFFAVHMVAQWLCAAMKAKWCCNWDLSPGQIFKSSLRLERLWAECCGTAAES